MTLYKKTVLALGVTIFALLLIMYGALSSIMLKSYAELEILDAIKNTERFRDAYLEELNMLDLTVKDWARWDTPFDFFKERKSDLEDSDFVKGELNDAGLMNLKNNIIAFFDTKGRLFYSTGMDLEKETKIKTPESFLKFADDEKTFKTLKTLDDKQMGLLILPEGPMIFAARAVFPTSQEGEPNGVLLMGRYLSQEVMNNLTQRTHLKTTSFLVNDQNLPPDFKDNLKLLNEKTPLTTSILNDKTVSGYLLLHDVTSEPVMVVRVDLERDIYHQGKKSLVYIVLTVLISGLVFGVVILIIIGRIVLWRVKRLSGEVEEIKVTSDLSMRVTTEGTDELSHLSEEVNEMLSTIETANQKEKQMMADLKKEQEKSEELLLNILPSAIVDRLKTNHGTIADHFTEATVLFADIVGFTQFSDKMPPAELVAMLNTIFSAFDHLTHKLGLEKIKTIGDNYMLVGGLPEPRPDHAQAVVEMALQMLDTLQKFNEAHGQRLDLRIGIHTGPVVAGVIGTKKFIYDLWGDTVNLASRMESHGISNRIQISAATYEKIQGAFDCEERGMISVKGKGEIKTFFVLNRKTGLAA